MRVFIEDMYKIQAPEQTTQEFLTELAQHPTFSKDVQQKLNDFLSQADLVKFARLEPTVEETKAATSTVVMRRKQSATSGPGFFQKRKQTVSGYFNDWTKWLRSEEGGEQSYYGYDLPQQNGRQRQSRLFG